ncbi:hypothetical protein [Citromicrobium sp. JLT1363]|uniref:hypothetical protein n=1 Tax=Citromicrobium sp. JLT1363 TaxID=517722 RepID=UPI001111A9A3|nr:hypothetical protein [Citromicrobium sp. JLT1363]
MIASATKVFAAVGFMAIAGFWAPNVLNAAQTDGVSTGSIRGTASAALNGSTRQCGRSSAIALSPVDEDSERLVREVFGGADQGRTSVEEDRELLGDLILKLPVVTQNSHCEYGQFEFSNVPAGEYFVFANLNNTGTRRLNYNPGEIFDFDDFEGIIIMQRVKVEAGDTEVIRLR